MKIEGNNPAPDSQATDATRRTGTDAAVRRGAAAGAPAAPSDRVELSADAALLMKALKAANESPDIRADLVQQVREKIAAGELGNDARRLADAMLDGLLK